MAFERLLVLFQINQNSDKLNPDPKQRTLDPSLFLMLLAGPGSASAEQGGCLLVYSISLTAATNKEGKQALGR